LPLCSVAAGVLLGRLSFDMWQRAVEHGLAVLQQGTTACRMIGHRGYALAAALHCPSDTTAACHCTAILRMPCHERYALFLPDMPSSCFPSFPSLPLLPCRHG
jgi:hypothetical protein